MNIPRLTARQLLIIRLVSEGLKNAEIGKRIGTSENVIKNYLRNIYDNIGVWNRTELALWYVARSSEGCFDALPEIAIPAAAGE